MHSRFSPDPASPPGARYRVELPHVHVSFSPRGPSETIISDSKTYGTVGAIFGIMTWFIAIGAVIILGAVAGVVWEDRRNCRNRSREQ